MLIISENAFFIRLFKEPDNARILGETVKNVLGKSYIIRAKSNVQETQEDRRAIDLVERAKANDIPVELQ